MWAIEQRKNVDTSIPSWVSDQLGVVVCNGNNPVDTIITLAMEHAESTTQSAFYGTAMCDLGKEFHGHGTLIVPQLDRFDVWVTALKAKPTLTVQIINTQTIKSLESTFQQNTKAMIWLVHPRNYNSFLKTTQKMVRSHDIRFARIVIENVPEHIARTKEHLLPNACFCWWLCNNLNELFVSPPNVWQPLLENAEHFASRFLRNNQCKAILHLDQQPIA